MNDPSQNLLFDIPPDWTKEWKGMPGYDHVDQESYRDLIVHFRNNEDIQAFSNITGQRITDQTKSLWYPPLKIEPYFHNKYVSTISINPQYPVYIISKGRWESRQTSRALEEMKVPYHIVIEPQEFNNYASVIDPRKILVLPFSNLGEGSIPARNWVWEHSIKAGARRHWILDDNIKGFHRYQNNFKQPVLDGTIFKAAEDFVDRYENVAISGFNYFMFVVRKSGRIPPMYMNTRIYSCILIQNTIPYRWRGRYNEDTDLSIRVLKDGWCTILFNAFLADKSTTLTMKGGNTDQLYQDNGRLLMAQSLQQQHPDIVRVTTKWGRPQHHVNYRGFRFNKLKSKAGVVVGDSTNDYGMTLTNTKEIDHETTSVRRTEASIGSEYQKDDELSRYCAREADAPDCEVTEDGGDGDE